ncbi:hypothetical protein BDW59DRAFT_163551 [Aspergillus cavernicola]|uniref:Uncharacterized protein n=1 Tax=Aspergillus cavernicola TaxID=176166 RepID=A0ABR4I618_9EURO
MSGGVVVLPMWPTEVSYASPVLTQATAGTSPPLKRTKRSNRSSEDSNVPSSSVDGFQEEDLRAGGPNLCEPPCYSIHLTPTHRLHNVLRVQQQHYNAIQGLAKQTHIRFSDLVFVGRKSRCNPVDAPVLTALLTVDHRANPDHRGGWVDFARTVWNYLKGCSLGENISVEIVDQRFNMNPFIFPCKPTDSVYPIWHLVCGRILASISLVGMLSVGCHRIGNAQEPDACMPNILVAVSAGTNRNWDQVRDSILGVLMEFHLHNVGVIIRKDVSLLSSGVLSGKSLQARKCTSTAHIGYSLGPDGSEDDQGTLGGFIEIQNPLSGQWVEFAMTCFHCVIPNEQAIARRSPGDLQIFSDWKRDGVRVADENACRLLNVDSPSQRDVQEGIEHLNQLIRDVRRNSVYQRVEEAMKNNEYVIGPDKGQWRAYCNQISVLDENKRVMQQYLNNKGHRLGWVFAASGFRDKLAASITPNPDSHSTVRDWALVKPTNGRIFGSNDFIECSSLEGVDRMELLPRATSLEPEAILHKMGCKTQDTEGRYDGLLTATIAREYVGGQWVEKATLEHTVVSNNRKEVFETGGDSGAFVYTSTGHVVGMCFGGPHHGDVGYFSHIHDILDDIEEITGATNIRLKQ